MKKRITARWLCRFLAVLLAAALLLGAVPAFAEDEGEAECAVEYADDAEIPEGDAAEILGNADAAAASTDEDAAASGKEDEGEAEYIVEYAAAAPAEDGEDEAPEADEDETAYIVKYKDGVVPSEEDDGLPFAVVSAEEMRKLDEAGLLEWYEPDMEMELLDVPETAYYSADKWDLALIGADAAFAGGYAGQGVRIAVIDSGINPHTMLAQQLRTGHNYVNENGNTLDSVGHGTLVAGLIAGYGEDGAIGMATASELIPLKITEDGSIYTSTVCAAIYGAIRDYGCHVLNLSLGITTEEKSLREAVEYAESRGVVVISAAGNQKGGTLYYPAAYETVIGVGAVDSSGDVETNFTHSDAVYLTAPGVNVKTTGKSGGYVTKSGTSFSTPIVSATAAVLLSIDDTLTPADIRTLLADTATDRGVAGWDKYYGYGVLNVAKAVAQAEGREPEEIPDTDCGFTSASTLRNYTDKDIDAAYFLAAYDDSGRCLGVRSWQLTLPAHGSVTIQPPDEGTNYGQFVCDADTMAPLAHARKP